MPAIENGMVKISTPQNRFAFENGYGEESPLITNFTTDAPVRSHSAGNWDRGVTLAIPGKKLLGKNVISTRPSDTFTYGNNIQVSAGDVSAITGRQKEIDFLRNKISELENEKEINNNNNYNEIKYQEMQKQIFSLKNEKDELQNKLMNYINSEMNNNKKINKILQEKNVLIKENEKLKNEIKELDNENHKNMLQLTKVSEFQKEYEIIKKENETNFEELKIKNEENEKLSNIILEKERENEQLKLQLANKMENMDEDYDNDILNVGRNNELQEKNNTIEKLERQINSMKI